MNPETEYLSVKKSDIQTLSQEYPEAKEALKKLCPEAFPLMFDPKKIYAYKSIVGNIFILKKCLGGFAWVSINTIGTDNYTIRSFENIISLVDRASNDSVFVFDTRHEFFIWAAEQTK